MPKQPFTPKKKMQNVSFNTVEEMLDFLPEKELHIVQVLRKLVFDCIPDCEEKLSWNIPSYRKHLSICFIWPGSVSWGGVQQAGVRFGFMHGNLLLDEINYLHKGGRKMVYWKDFYEVKDIDIPLLRSYIFEAAMVDEEQAKMKAEKKRKRK